MSDLLIRLVEKTDVVSHIHMSFAVCPPLCHVALLEDSINVKTLFVAKDTLSTKVKCPTSPKDATGVYKTTPIPLPHPNVLMESTLL